MPACVCVGGWVQDFTYVRVEPSWAQDGEWADNFMNGTATEIRVVTEAKPNGVHPFIALDSFEICGVVRPDAKPPHPSRGGFICCISARVVWSPYGYKVRP